MSLFFLILGLATLIFGGEFLVKGATGVARKFGLSPLVIGLTVVAFGTSAPELIISVKAAFQNNPEIAIGNVIGSNVANIALVLGLTTIIFPIVVDRNSIRYDWPMTFLATALFGLFAWDLKLEAYEGIVFLVILVIYIVFLLYDNMKRNKASMVDPELAESKTFDRLFLRDTFLLLVGCVGLFFGSEWFLNGAVGIAEYAGLSKHVIAVTVVAFGTSVPELVTSILAALKKETDIAVGNLLGSNIFNIFLVLGITGIVKPINIEPRILSFDFFWMMGILLLLFPIMIIGKKVYRLEGALLLTAYIVYTVLLLVRD